MGPANPGIKNSKRANADPNQAEPVGLLPSEPTIPHSDSRPLFPRVESQRCSIGEKSLEHHRLHLLSKRGARRHLFPILCDNQSSICREGTECVEGREKLQDLGTAG